MARISIRFFVDDGEVERIDADLPGEAPEIVATCREWVDDWIAASQPPSEEEAASFEEAFKRRFGTNRQSLEERIRREQELAQQMVDHRRHAEKVLAERKG